MRIRCFAIEPLRSKPNGNSLRKGDWAMVSYANDIFEVPDASGDADITRKLIKYINPGDCTPCLSGRMNPTGRMR